ncbi:MAG: cryptochrome/photolyase family protein [Pseudomonadota bacterium]
MAIILILGDQLTLNISSLRGGDRAADTVLMAEVMSEASYVRHHKKKLALVFSAMRHFAERLRGGGWRVRYIQLDDPDNTGDLGGEISRARAALEVDQVIATEAGEHRLRGAIAEWGIETLPDDRFFCSETEFASWASGRKQLRMEYFYREMRRKTGLLMDGDQPVGGKWNFDAENRKPARGDLFMPRPPRTEPDEITYDVLDMIERRFPDNFGDLRPFWFSVTAEGAEQALDWFVAEALPQFGDYQDAMLAGEPFLYHSVLSPYINLGLLDPLKVCRRVEQAWLEGCAPLNAAEGFIRQIIGWREYVRGIYFLQGPDYVRRNHFGARRPLPEFYWTGETEMACLAAAIGQTRREAYAHHIQRLMVTGNFAMLAGVDPHEVHEWYLAVYADAFEWVEAPNTVGMSQFADGGLLGSKPYAASGAYINRMSDYCGECRYDVKKKTGADACPFNALYWDFLARNRDTLDGNPRLRPVWRNWDRLGEDRQAEYRASASAFLRNI